jgi:nitrous oxide reductase
MRRASGAMPTLFAVVCGLTMLAVTPPLLGQAAAQAPTETFTIVAVDVDSVEFWLPSTINVEQGDRVRLILKNMMGGAPAIHGFAIPAYKIAVLVPHGATKTVEFTADKAGIFPYICQIHAQHMGGQLIVHPHK